uniref:TetR/AcrR family transcriptional regulator n=1 Tax=Janibacter limosus TaxID=53458 RepID=UPI0024811212
MSNAPATRRPRGYLSAEAILSGAFDLAEQRTVGDVSMPKLAKHLGVGVTSLYWYFRSKDALIEAMRVEAAHSYLAQLAGLEDEPWDEHLLSYFRRMKEIFWENPVICDLLAFRAGARDPGSLFFERIDHEVALLLDAGFEDRIAAAAYQTMSVFTQGVVQRQRLFDLDQKSREASGEDMSDDRPWQLELTPGRAFPALEQTMPFWS